jgi:hypothetical protein
VKKTADGQGTVKAGALLCPKCLVEYVEIEVDFEYDNIIMRRVKVLRCPLCQEELFTPEQHNTIMERIGSENTNPGPNPT